MAHAPPQEKPALPGRQPSAARLGEVLLIFLVFFSVAGDPVPGVNEPHYLCRLKHFWNPDWCPGDLFLESKDGQVVFLWAFGWVTRWLSLGATAWLGRVLAWASLAWAWQRLSWRLVPRPLYAVLSAALWVPLTARANFAGEWIVGGVEAKCFAYALVLLALYEWVDGRWNWLWLWLGAAIALHPVVGAWSAVLCGGIWLIEDRRRTRFSAMLPGLATGGLLALVGVVPALLLTYGQPPDVVAEAAHIYVFERLPHHLALLTLPGEEIAARFVYLALLLLALWSLKRAVCLVDAFAPADRTTLRQISRFAWGAVLVAVIGLVIELALWNHPLIAARVLRYYWFRLVDFAVPAAVALNAIALIAAGMERRRTWATWGLVAALVLAGAHVSLCVRGRLLDPTPPADRRVRDYATWMEVCDWVAANTAPNALFVTPRLSQTFKWRTGRPEVVTRKDIPQDARSIVAWHDRLKAVHYQFDPVEDRLAPAKSLGHLGTEHVQQMARRYGADYVLTDRRRPLALPVVYMNEEYVVYAVEGSADGRGPAPLLHRPNNLPQP